MTPDGNPALQCSPLMLDLEKSTARADLTNHHRLLRHKFWVELRYNSRMGNGHGSH